MSLKNRKIEYKGMLLTIPQWRVKLGIRTISAWCIYQRIFTYNWPVEKAFKDEKLGRRDNPGKRVENNLTQSMIDNGIESVQLSMLCRGYFRKENRIKVYKMLNTWYKEFRSENMKAA